MRRLLLASVACLAVLAGTSRGYAQHWSLGGNMGLSVFGGSPGLHVTPSAEVLFSRHLAVGSEFSINTQYGAPLILHPYFKCYFDIRGSQWRPFASVGPVLAFNVSDGPRFGFLFGAGFNIPVARKLYLSPNILIGPVFNVGGGQLPLFLRGYYWGIETYGLTFTTVPGITVLAFTLRGGLRFEL
ncbi:MAG: hypothetical protein KF749_03605 [Bacteroidetes bacterium]|nr:hypothetical protein [Bacteroidota bacterium]MCW5897548.1 hypothetical protein [Bacteroidota bacterium]